MEFQKEKWNSFQAMKNMEDSRNMVKKTYYVNTVFTSYSNDARVMRKSRKKV